MSPSSKPHNCQHFHDFSLTGTLLQIFMTNFVNSVVYLSLTASGQHNNKQKRVHEKCVPHGVSLLH